MKKSIYIFFLLTLASIQMLYSCVNNETAIIETTSGSITESSAETATEEAYIYPDIDYSGEEFNILNLDTDWGFYYKIDQEEMTGEALDDAIYNRNRLIEDKFNIKIKETNQPLLAIHDKIRTAVLSGDDTYDAIFCPGIIYKTIGALITEGLLQNLMEIPELNLNESWWNQAIIRDGVIGDDKALYFASNDISIMALQGAWCLYFNEDMMTDLGLEKPYDLVKSGKWTFDELQKYMKAGAQLNGDDSFKWSQEGKSVYGLTSFTSFPGALKIASGERYITKDKDGKPYFSLETDRFYDVCDKISSMLGVTGEYLTANNYGTPFHFESIFMNGRALFLAGEIKASNTFRGMEDTYGLVPNPKFDLNQKEYYSMQLTATPMLIIPVTNNDLSRAGVVIDAMAYVSYRDVTPVFYDVTVSQKGLRNEESIEMLKIIRNTMFYDVGILYGWTLDLYNAVCGSLDLGKNNISSLIEAQKDIVAINIQETMDELYK